MLHSFSVSKQILKQKISKYTSNTTKNQNKTIYSQYISVRGGRNSEIDRESAILVPTEDCSGQIGKERDQYQRRTAAARSGGCGFAEMGIRLGG